MHRQQAGNTQRGVAILALQSTLLSLLASNTKWATPQLMWGT
jgi:hypothetical protein